MLLSVKRLSPGGEQPESIGLTFAQVGADNIGQSAGFSVQVILDKAADLTYTLLDATRSCSDIQASKMKGYSTWKP